MSASLLQKFPKYFYTKYRAFALLSSLESPRADVLRGWRRWRWLIRQRKLGRLIEPSVRFQGDVESLDERMLLSPGTHLDIGCILWIGNEGEGFIHLAERVYVGPYSFLGTASHRLQVGVDTMIGAHAYVITENHCTHRKDIPYATQGYCGADVTIGKNVWLGCHVTVLPGVTIGDNAIVGAGAVVTKSIPNGETWVGVPARKLER
jgi:acetyltransferase-like isoleucine patch superfamily enzyme